MNIMSKMFVVTTLIGTFSVLSIWAADAQHLAGIHWWGPVSDTSGSEILDVPPVGPSTGTGWDLEIVITHDAGWSADNLVSLYQTLSTQRNITLITRIDYLWGAGIPATTDPNYSSWPSSVVNVVNKLKDYCHIWLIGNEENIYYNNSGYTYYPDKKVYPQHYATTYRAVRTAIKNTALPSPLGPHRVLIVPASPGGIVTFTNDGGGERWMDGADYLRAVLAELSPSEVDGFGLHAYGGTRSDFQWGYSHQLAVIDELGFGSKPAYITEWNRGVDTNNPLTSEPEAAQFVRDAFADLNTWNNTSGRHPIVGVMWFVFESMGWNSMSLKYWRDNGATGTGDLFTAYKNMAQLKYRSGFDFSTGDVTAPATPTLNSPTAGTTITTLPITFNWTAVTDTGSPPVRYDLQVDNNNSFNSPEVNQTGLSLSSYTVTTLANGTYYWRVRSQDSASTPNKSGWWSLSPRSFILNKPADSTGPVSPTLTSPGNSTLVSSLPIIFDWTDVDDTSTGGSNPCSYTIQIDNNSNYTSPEINVTGLAASQHTVSYLPNGVYYWRVQAVDSAGNPSTWSTGQTFTLNNTSGITYYGNQFIAMSTQAVVIDGMNDKASLRFTCQQGGILNRIRFFVVIPAAVPGYLTVGIQKDSNGFPDGTWITSGEAYPPGSAFSWILTDVPDVNITAGTVYHLVIQPSVGGGTFDSSHVLEVRVNSPLNQRIWSSQMVDTNQNVLFYDGLEWNVLGFTPTYVLEYIDSYFNLTYEGIPDRESVARFPGYYIIGSTWCGESFVPDFNYQITAVGLYVQKIGIPTGNIEYDLRGPDDYNTVLETGQFATPNEVSTTGGWQDVNLTTTRTLSANSRYWIMFKAPNGTDLPNHYHLSVPDDGSVYVADITGFLTFGSSVSYYYTAWPGGSVSAQRRDLTFRLSLAGGSIDTTAPPSPGLTSPTNSSTLTNNRPTFDWDDVTDTNNQSPPVSYEIQVDTDVNFSTPDISQTNLTVSQFPANVTLTNGTYYWHVRARDSAPTANSSAWSTEWSFTVEVIVDTTPPPVPTLIQPANVSEQNVNRPVFSWSAVSDVNNHTPPIKYELQVDNEPGFSVPVSINLTNLSITATTATVSLANGTYYWRVRAGDSAAPVNNSNWSSTYSFNVLIIVDTTPPPVPSLTQPVNGFVYISSAIPSFSWSIVTDVSNHTPPVLYDLQVDTENGFNLPLTVNQLNLAGTQYTPTSSFNNGTYYWRVRSRDSTATPNFSNWSSTGNFTVNIDTTGPDITAPPVPTLLSPVNGTIVSTGTTSFDWTDVTDINNQSPPVLYELQVSTDIQFGVINHSTTTLNSSSVFSNLSISLYYWRVRSRDSATAPNYSSWSSVWNLTVNISTGGTNDLIPPPVPNLLSPVNNVVESTGTPVFDWEDVTDINNQSPPVRYELQVDNNSNFSSPEINQPNLTVSRYAPTTALTNGTYYWRVRAKDNAGTPNLSQWSATRTVTVRILTDVIVLNITNPGFESGLTGWNLNTVTGVSYTGDTVVWHTGSQSAKIVSTTQSSNVYLWQVTGTNSVIPEQNYKFWVWVKTDTVAKSPGAYGASLRLTWKDNSLTTTLQENYIEGPIGTVNTWVKLGSSVQSPLGAERVEISLFLHNASGTVWFDNVNSEENSVDTTPPYVPVLNNPANNIAITSLPVTFDWTDVTDVDNLSLPIKYDFQIDEDSTFSTPEINQSAITVSQYVLNTSLPNGTYYWRVRAGDSVNPSNYSSWTEMRSFRVNISITSVKKEPKPEERFVTPSIPAKFGTDAEEVKIYDPGGGLAVELKNTEFADRQIMWNGTDKGGKHLESGAYIYKVKGKDGKSTYGMLILAK